MTTSNESNDSVDAGKKLMAEIISNVLLFLLIFGMSATVDASALMNQFRNKFAICTGLGMQFIIMPLLGFLTVKVLDGHGMNMEMGITLLIVTSSPGGSYSNWWCSMFNADLTLSVAMTALSTLLSTLFLPANLVMYAHAAYGADDVLKNVNFPKLFISLGIVIAAIFVGLTASILCAGNKKFNRMANRMGSLCGLALVVFSFFVSTDSKEKEAKLWGQDWTFYVGVSLPCVVGLLLANVLSFIIRGNRSDSHRLDKPQVVTISVECCYQNVGIATSAAISMFSDPKVRGQAVCVPLFYGFLEAVLLGVYCLVAWKLGWTRAPPNEKICVVIAKTYEVVDDELATNTSKDSHMIAEEQPIGKPQDINNSIDESYMDHETNQSRTDDNPSDNGGRWFPWPRRKSRGAYENHPRKSLTEQEFGNVESGLQSPSSLLNKRASKATKEALDKDESNDSNRNRLPSTEMTIVSTTTGYTTRDRNQSEEWLISLTPQSKAKEEDNDI